MLLEVKSLFNTKYINQIDFISDFSVLFCGSDPVQNEGVEYGTVVTSNQKKKGDDVQYRELVFNTPAQKKSKLPKVQEDCVYSGVQRS
ncbi:MAG: hypothetical protein ACRCVL_03915 [Cetobacterium sp.]